MCICLSLSLVLSHAHTLQLEEEEEKEDKFDLNISVTNPEKVGKSIPCNCLWLTTKEVVSVRTHLLLRPAVGSRISVLLT